MPYNEYTITYQRTDGTRARMVTHNANADEARESFGITAATDDQGMRDAVILSINGLTEGQRDKMRGYAIHFALATSDEPTDERLSEVLKSCALPPRPEWYPEIRQQVDEYRNDPSSIGRP